MMNVTRISMLILGAGIEMASANSQRFDVVLGQTESIDLRYGYEWPYVGVGITPGIGQFLISKARSDEVVPTSWNPSISIFKSVSITERIWLVPNVAATYWYGSGGMHGQGFGTGIGILTREDKLYLKGGMGIQIRSNPIFVEFNPGFTTHRVHTTILNGDDAGIRKNNGKYTYDGIYVSGSIGIQFGAI